MLPAESEKYNSLIHQLTNVVLDPTLKQFITTLYSGLPYYEIKEFSHDYLIKAATQTLKLLGRRNKGEHLVNFFRPDKNEDIVIIEVINDDIPFLIDSISNQLKLEDFDIHLIVHPSIHTERDIETGKLINISETADLKEAVMQFHVSKLVSDDYYVQLMKRIREILECVTFAVQDWVEMKNFMVESKQSAKNFLYYREVTMKDEILKLLDWLIEANFIFLGTYKAEVRDGIMVPIQETKLGLARAEIYHIAEEPIDEQYDNSDVLFFRKWDTRSIVHRTAHMDHIVIKNFDQYGNCISSYNFLGFFTSSVYYQSVKNIPLIRMKIGNIIKKYGYPESSHNCKELVTALEAFPRGELIQMSEEELYETSTGIVSLALMPRVKLFLRKDKAEKFISCLIFVPKNRFSIEIRESIEKMLCRAFNGFISKQYVSISESMLARVQILVRTHPHSIPEYNIDELEQNIKALVSNWIDELYEELFRNSNKKEARSKMSIFKDAFDIKFTSTFSPKQAVFDIAKIEDAYNNEKVQFEIYQVDIEGQRAIELKIYSPEIELPISSTLPILEHMGFFALDVITHEVHLKETTWGKDFFIHHFHLQSKDREIILDEQSKINIQNALDNIWSGKIEDDRFNSLILYCGLNWKQANMMRAYSKYLKQINFPLISQFIVEALINNFEITCDIVKLFEQKFNIFSPQDSNATSALEEKLNNALLDVQSISEDRVMRAYINLVLATKRTNYYQQTSKGKEKEYLAFKIASSEVADIPLPKPFAEIFVFSTRFEAIHLRGGKVARGGLRWSDRSEDFRTEVLGLMKAQMTKNSVIVPVGSKGGFILKKLLPNITRELLQNEGIACYKLFLSGLLDLTDNIIDGKIVPPPQVIRHDGDDPYLVVAADKGTASFSDYANSISNKYKFWLGDAFASGGSVGYDHKKMAITAKGGWISVERHFSELGHDIKNNPFTVVGIGDMSGDVFGNGMLLSKNIKLVAAFNHMHIFLDPNPDCEKSFFERQRLFDLPRSQWSDYDKVILSEGGAIHFRAEKTIKISPQMMEILQVKKNVFSPDELIKAILLAPVDLLWNGGIGTYIKSHNETNEMIGDKNNDNLRVNAKDLRCLIIGEGGNLGVTQLGRIEYAKNEGKINTDFIDNSAGVDCSDHEVNIKIAFSESLSNNKIAGEKRDNLLYQMTDEVAQLVLKDNFKQTQIISIEESKGKERFEQQAWIIKNLEELGELNREIEFLPSEEQLATRKSEGGKLTRPELSVLLAYAKNSIFKMLAESDFSKDRIFEKVLISYFPQPLIEQYKENILSHKLKGEIIATVLINEFVNILGFTFFHQLLDETKFKPIEIISAFIAVKEIYDLESYWLKIELMTNVPSDIKIILFKELQILMKRNISWFLRHNLDLNNISNLIDFYKEEVRKVILNYNEMILENDELEEFMVHFKDYSEHSNIFKEIGILKVLDTPTDIALIASEFKQDVVKVGVVFHLIGRKLHLDWMLNKAKNFYSNIYLENLALRNLIEEIEDIRIALVKKELELQLKDNNQILDKLEFFNLTQTHVAEQLDKFISNLKANQSDSWIPLLIIAAKRVKECLNV